MSSIDFTSLIFGTGFDLLTGERLMADDINSGLRAEIEAQRTLLAPIIRGDHDLAKVSISPDLQGEVVGDATELERRMGLLTTVIQWLDGAVAAMQALENDGYPDLPKTQLSAALMAELAAQKVDLEAAIARFVPQQAATLAISLGTPEPKPTP